RVVASGLAEPVGTAAVGRPPAGRRRDQRRHPLALHGGPLPRSMIGFVTDSNAQLPAELVERYTVEVVPLTVTIDGTPYLEGVDIDTDGFYARFESGRPEVSTSQPSPGQFSEAYARAASRGVDET